MTDIFSSCGDEMKDVINSTGEKAERKGICLDELDFGIEGYIDSHAEQIFSNVEE